MSSSHLIITVILAILTLYVLQSLFQAFLSPRKSRSIISRGSHSSPHQNSHADANEDAKPTNSDHAIVNHSTSTVSMTASNGDGLGELHEELETWTTKDISVQSEEGNDLFCILSNGFMPQPERAKRMVPMCYKLEPGSVSSWKCVPLRRESRDE